MRGFFTTKTPFKSASFTCYVVLHSCLSGRKITIRTSLLQARVAFKYVAKSLLKSFLAGLAWVAILLTFKANCVPAIRTHTMFQSVSIPLNDTKTFWYRTELLIWVIFDSFLLFTL